MARVLCIGHAVEDFVFGVDAMPDRPAKFRARSFYEQGGGPAATAAVTIVRLGGEAVLAARLGEDPVGALILAELDRFGVDTRACRRFSGRRSALSSVLIDEAGERTIVNYSDPDMPADPSWLKEALLEDVDAVLGDCRWPEGSRHMLGLARDGGLPAILDADLPMRGEDALIAAASHVAFSTPGLADYRPDHEPADALAAIHAATGAWCAVTRGEGGTLCHGPQGFMEIAAFPVVSIDTLGAGDVWHGAFALALAEGQDEPQAARFANAAAALRVSRRGGRDAIPTREEVEAHLL
ncbi:MAG: sugar kinase [Rhodothalassiaceae bacterium]